MKDFKPSLSGYFLTIEDIFKYFRIKEEEVENGYDSDWRHIEILMAHYSKGYSGEATVLLFDYETHIYFEVNGTHCSCHGLEGQFYLEEIGDFNILSEYIELRRNSMDGYGVSKMISKSGYTVNDINEYVKSRFSNVDKKDFTLFTDEEYEFIETLKEIYENDNILEEGDLIKVRTGKDSVFFNGLYSDLLDICLSWQDSHKNITIDFNKYEIEEELLLEYYPNLKDLIRTFSAIEDEEGLTITFDKSIIMFKLKSINDKIISC